MATVLGVALGVPLGLFINRKSEEEKNKSEYAGNLKMFINLLYIIRNNVNLVSITIGDIIEKSEKHRVSDARIDLATWPAIAQEFLPQLPLYDQTGIDLSQNISDFYRRANSIQSKCDRLMELAYFRVQAENEAEFLEVSKFIETQFAEINEICQNSKLQKEILLSLIDKIHEVVKSKLLNLERSQLLK